MSNSDQFYDSFLNQFSEITKNPENFLDPDPNLPDKIKQHLKSLYDKTKSEEIKKVKSNALPELIIKNFDLEQIWQQIELQNDSILLRSLTNVSKLLVNKDKLVFKSIETEKDDTQEEEPNAENDSSSESDDSEGLDQEDIPDEEDSELEGDESNSNNNRKYKASIVDDQFFKLNEMEAFLNQEEKKMEEPDSGNDSEDDEDDEEEEIDFFKDSEGEDEDDKVKTAKFKDFFVEAPEEKKETKRNKFLEGLEDKDDEEDNQKSTLEMRQERLQKRIEELEEKAIGEKPWQLKGEINAENRPINSLLEEIVEFDMTARPAPVITEQTTLQLEDIIKQRIKDKVFDSVVRKAKPVESLLEYKKKLVLDQEKSKQSLAQIYEKEYLDQQAALDPANADKEEEEPELHKEIKTMMNTLFHKLDSLSNFHFTPKPSIPELKVVSNVPAISMEEVAPVAASNATLLAPEEVRRKPRTEILGKGERTATDKKRERRKKKIKQKVHAQLQKKKVEDGKVKDKKVLEKAVKGRNVERIDESSGGKSIKSSKAFFTQLQEEVKTHINGKKVEKRKKNNKGDLDAKRMKL